MIGRSDSFKRADGNSGTWNLAHWVDQHLTICGGIVLAVTTSLIFAPAIHSDFVNFDDPVYILENHHIQAGLTWETLRWAFTSGYAANWHPLTWISHALDYRMFHLQPWGHHLTSVLLHVSNTLLLFIFLTTITGAIGRSFVAAALFGVHPLHVESVVWVSERKDVLCGLFWILGMLSYARYVSLRDCRKTSRRVYYGLTLVLFTLGLASKPMAITFPICLLLLDYWPLGRFDRGQTELSRFLKLALAKWPFFALSALSAIVAYVVHHRGGAMKASAYFPLSVRLANVPVSYCRYLGKIFYPVDLSPFYIHPRIWASSVLASTTLLLIAVSISALWLRHRMPYLLTGWTWFIIALLPVIGIIQAGTQSIADRYTYVPSIGLFIALCWLIPESLANFRHRNLLTGSAAAVILLTLVLLTRRQVAYWENSEKLFRHALFVQPNNALAHVNLGVTLAQSGRIIEAKQHLQEALQSAEEIGDGMAGTYFTLGMLLSEEGKFYEAITNYQQGLGRRPNDAKGHLLLGIALHQLGSLEASLEEFRTAARLQPDLVEAYNNLGMIYREQGNLDAAIQAYRSALAIRPTFDDAHNNLGIALSLDNRSQEALAEFEHAIQLNPSSARFHANLAAELERLNKLDEAIAQYREALRLAPDHSDAIAKLIQLLARKQKDQAPEPK